jgi:hypothetical protein
VAEETNQRAAIYSKKLGRRMYAADILAHPEERASKAIAVQLSVQYRVEFMELCRKALPPESITHHIDRERRIPPAMRSMYGVMQRSENRSLLEVVLNDFNDKYPDFYFDILERLYGSKTIH